MFVADSDAPRLTATTCYACGYVDFPPQAYGCRQCGAYGADLRAEEIGTAGTVVSSAVVAFHPDPAVPVPYTVAAISLDAGPAIRAIMRDPTPLAIGDAVHGELAETDGRTELRFAKGAG